MAKELDEQQSEESKDAETTAPSSVVAEESTVETATEDANEIEDYELWGSDPDPVVPPKWRPLLPLVLLLLVGFVMFAFRTDVSYYLSSTTPIELGSLADGCDKPFYKKLRHNIYARVTKAFMQPEMSTQARMQFAKRTYLVILGCDLIIAVNKKRLKKVAGVRFSAEGRLYQINRTNALQPLRDFYERRQALKFTDNFFLLMDKEKPRERWWILLLYIVLSVLFLFGLKQWVSSTWRFWIKGETLD